MKSLPGSASGKDHEGSEILPCLLANKLACHSFKDVKRKQIPGSEAEGLITHGSADSMSFMLALVPLVPKPYGGKVEIGPGGGCTYSGYVSAEEL